MHLFSLLQSNYKINCAEQIPLDISTCGHPHRIPERAKSLIQRRIGPSWNIVGRSIRKNLMLVLHGPLLKAWIARALETSGERGLFFMSACIRHYANEKCKQRKNSLRYGKWRKPRNQCHQQQQKKLATTALKHTGADFESARREDVLVSEGEQNDTCQFVSRCLFSLALTSGNANI